MATVSDLLNQVWSEFRKVGISYDLAIIEHIAAFLLEINEQEFPDEELQPRKPNQPNLNTQKIKQLLTEAANTAGGTAKLLDRHVIFYLPNMLAGGGYPTPRHIAKSMISLAQVEANHSLADFACGSAGLLVNHAHKLQGLTIGIDISSEWARIAYANVKLHELNAKILNGNALQIFALSSELETTRFDRILINPPFGAKIDAYLAEISLEQKVGSRSETALLSLALQKLSLNGRAAVLVPSGVLFSNSTAERNLRHQLVDENSLEAVISYPKDAFQPYSPLQDIAQDPTPTTDKRKWVKQIALEAFRLLKRATGTLEPLNYQTITSWQNAASDFLIGFYENVLREVSSPRKKNPGFPRYIFSDNNPSAFGAQNFLTAFQAENATLFICPACDESKYSTKAGSIQTDIDHYLPKSKYPHLACHPYNLVPSCLVCNQRIKRESDPLTCQRINPGARRKLEDIFCLYREPGLWDKTYLEVSLKSKNLPTQIGSLKTQGSLNIGDRIEVLQETYRIPERWSKQVDEIEDYIYRKLKNLLNAFHVSLNDSQTLLDCFDYSLSTDYIEEQGQHPFSISRAWLLATLINETEEVLKTSSNSPAKSSALLDELKRRLVNDVDAKSPNKLSTANLFQKAEARSSIDKARQLRSILTGN